MSVQSILKAVAGGVTAALTALLTAAAGGHITTSEWLAVALAALATFGGVYAAPPPKAEPATIRWNGAPINPGVAQPSQVQPEVTQDPAASTLTTPPAVPPAAS
jgi:hypothetical protein